MEPQSRQAIANLKIHITLFRYSIVVAKKQHIGFTHNYENAIAYLRETGVKL